MNNDGIHSIEDDESPEKFRMLHELNQVVKPPETAERSANIASEEEIKRLERERKKKSLFDLIEELFGELDHGSS